MNVTLIFLAAVGAVIIWWMSGQRLTSKPWLEAGVVPPTGMDRPHFPAVKIGLYVFLGVVGALFILFVSAYFMRMTSSDWWSTPVPPILWLNTGILIFASVTLQLARTEVRRNREHAVRHDLSAGFILTVLFLVGQVAAWRELASAGYVFSANPSYSFFYLLTGLHGLHILGGLIVLGRTAVQAFSTDMPRDRLRLNIDLCAVYSHFMLAVWLLLFAIFAGWANDFADLCRQLLT
ncbi:cytochrome c oxidase subunit 3 [Agrobacterium tumefaciens]|uniref:cytochrome c oxidase subunit 3 n=1 Tax=Agrobacterium tumefaciens TaxID=358 RepID=UPI00287CE321|nr:cytochrome c oxidase subunit 3 [Agrobacterium tumefaciens]MDS7594223.1 cytochrome c oxidase subunit 3 [Agrobacterium tumefaciens]